MIDNPHFNVFSFSCWIKTPEAKQQERKRHGCLYRNLYMLFAERKQEGE